VHVLDACQRRPRCVGCVHDTPPQDSSRRGSRQSARHGHEPQSVPGELLVRGCTYSSMRHVHMVTRVLWLDTAVARLVVHLYDLLCSDSTIHIVRDRPIHLQVLYVSTTYPMGSLGIRAHSLVRSFVINLQRTPKRMPDTLRASLASLRWSSRLCMASLSTSGVIESRSWYISLASIKLSIS